MKISNPLNEIEIKQINKKDANNLMAKNLKSVADSGYQTGSPWSEKQFSDTLETDNSIIFVAKTINKLGERNHPEKIIGLLIAVDTKVEADVYMITVRDEYKNNRVGRQLFEAFIKYCRKEKIQDIFLEVRVTNEPAIRLYERMCFIKIGQRKKYYSNPTEDALLMKKEL